MDLSVEVAADQLRIAPGSLRNIESGQPRAVVSLHLAYRAARLYGLALEDLVATTTENPEPSKQPKQEPKREPLAPPKRQDREKGPRRVQDKAVA